MNMDNLDLTATLENLKENIRTYESDTFSATAENLTEEEADKILAFLLNQLTKNKYDGIDMQIALEQSRTKCPTTSESFPPETEQ
jgi:hypothetical protein